MVIVIFAGITTPVSPFLCMLPFLIAAYCCVQEGRAFSAVDGNGIGLNDGVLSGLLKRSGWKVCTF